MSNEKFMYKCYVCGSAYQHGPHRYEGHLLKLYDNIMCCDTCWECNWDGWNPDTAQKLVNHLKAKNLPIPPRNSKGNLPRD